MNIEICNLMVCLLLKINASSNQEELMVSCKKLTALPILLSWSSFRSAFHVGHVHSKFRCCFLNFCAFFYGITMKSIEILGNYSGSVDKRCDTKIVYVAGFYISLCTIHFYDLLAKYSEYPNHEKYCFRGREEEGLQSTVMIICLRRVSFKKLFHFSNHRISKAATL